MAAHRTLASTARNSRASFSRCTASCEKSRRQKVRSASVAQVLSSIRVLPVASDPFQLAPQAGASASRGGPGRVHLEGRQVFTHQAFTFAPVQRVIQWVTPWSLFIEAPMTQIPLRLLCRLDAPSVVPPSNIKQLQGYREAVRFCWEQRKVRNMTRARLAEEAGLYAPHVTCYLSLDERKRDLPAEKVAAFERVCGNTAISQWLALQSQLTVYEEVMAERNAA